jgi:ADP-L-glycero-D-manno-heptose 6-epimerase
MKLILTGAAGFIGSCFLRKCNDMGAQYVYIVDTPSSPNNIPNLKKKKFKDYFSREDLLDRLEKGQLDDVDGIIHLGACADTTEMDRAFLKRNNLEYSQVLAKWALGRGKFFHYASSASVYGDGKKGYSDDPALLTQFSPLNPYAESKWLFDRWIIDQKLLSKVVGYRYFNVFGPNEYHKGEMRSMVNKAYDQIKAGGKARLFANSRPGHTDGSEERDFIYVKDVDDVMAFFLEHLDKGGIFNVGTGTVRYFRDLVSAVFKALGLKNNIEYFPMPEKLRNQYQYFTQADVTQLRQAGYLKPFTSLEDSVADYVKNYLSKEDPIY